MGEQLDKNIEFLISTMNKLSFSFVDIMFKNIQTGNYKILVINQCSDDIYLKIIEKDFRVGNMRVLSVLDSGLSKSRNLAIKNATSEFCVLTDDDVIFEENCIDAILSSFRDDVDVCTFRATFYDGTPFKSYKKYRYRHNVKSIMRISSIECAFRLSFIRKQSIFFDEAFGLGAKFPACEENIFFRDLLSKRARVFFLPINIVKHPNVKTGGILNSTGFYTRGAAFFRMFGYVGLLFAFFFLIKKSRSRKTHGISFLEGLNLVYNGFKEYKLYKNGQKSTICTPIF